MATLNVGAMSARLGLDPAEFLDKMKGVQGVNAFASAEMRREWQQTTREGTESFRLLDESLGIHISRPLTKLIATEFPGFAKAMQGILGASAIGALGAVGFEFGEHIAKSMEKARKALQDYDDAQRHTQQVLGDLAAAHAKTMKEIELRSAEIAGKPGAKIDAVNFKIDSAALEEGKRQVGEIAEAMQKEAKAAANAQSWTTKFWNTVALVPADFWGKFFGLGSDQADAADAKFKDFKRTLDQIMQVHSADPLEGLRDSLKRTKEEITAAGLEIGQKMRAITAAQAEITIPGIMGKTAEGQHNSGVDQAALDARAKFIVMLKQEAKVLADILQEDNGRRRNAGDADAAERQLKAQEAIEALQKEMGSSLSKLQPETNPIKKLETEIAGFRMAAENDFRAIRESATSALDIRFAAASLASYEKRLDALKIKLEGDIIAKQMLDLMGQKGTFPVAPTSAATPISIATPPAVPTLGAGGLASAQLDTFAKDQVAQLKMAAAAYQDALGPQQRFQLTEQELDLLLGKKLIDQHAYNAALAQAISLKARSAKEGLEGSVDELNPGGGKMQELQQRSQVLQGMQSSGVGLDGAKLNEGDIAAIRLEMQALQEEEDQILLKTGGIDAGIKAWANDLQRVQSEGEFVFQELTQASKGFEDNAAKSLIDILDAQRGGHQKLIKELRTMWAGYFNSLAEMAIKHGLQELLAPIGKQISGPGGIFGRGVNAATGSAAGAAGAASMTTAGTMLQSAATALMSAAAALRMSGSMGGGAASDGSIFGIGGGTAVPFFAEGGDATPGSSFISGEAGAEEVNLDRSGGAHITPLGFSAGKGGDTHQYFDQRGAVVTDDLMRKGDAVRMMAATKMSAVGEAVTKSSEIARRSLGSR